MSIAAVRLREVMEVIQLVECPVGEKKALRRFAIEVYLGTEALPEVTKVAKVEMEEKASAGEKLLMHAYQIGLKQAEDRTLEKQLEKKLAVSDDLPVKHTADDVKDGQASQEKLMHGPRSAARARARRKARPGGRGGRRVEAEQHGRGEPPHAARPDPPYRPGHGVSAARDSQASQGRQKEAAVESNQEDVDAGKEMDSSSQAPLLSQRRKGDPLGGGGNYRAYTPPDKMTEVAAGVHSDLSVDRIGSGLKKGDLLKPADVSAGQPDQQGCSTKIDAFHKDKDLLQLRDVYKALELAGLGRDAVISLFTGEFKSSTGGKVKHFKPRQGSDDVSEEVLDKWDSSDVQKYLGMFQPEERRGSNFMKYLDAESMLRVLSKEYNNFINQGRVRHGAGDVDRDLADAKVKVEAIIKDQI